MFSFIKKSQEMIKGVINKMSDKIYGIIHFEIYFKDSSFHMELFGTSKIGNLEVFYLFLRIDFYSRVTNILR